MNLDRDPGLLSAGKRLAGRLEEDIFIGQTHQVVMLLLSLDLVNAILNAYISFELLATFSGSLFSVGVFFEFGRM